MQLTIRGSQNYVLEFSGSETLSELRAKVAEVEKAENVSLSTNLLLLKAYSFFHVH